MGVYIPPNNSDNNGDDSSKTSVWRYFIHNKLAYSPNPSFGLKIWGPLVPSSDNVTGLRILTGFQLFLGMLILRRSRLFRNKRLGQLGIPNTFDKRFRKWGYGLFGSFLIYNSGFEIVRLLLPYDPWSEEAKYYKNLALRNGDPVSWWFGSRNYTPMSLQEFLHNFENWADNKYNLEDINQDVIIINRGNDFPESVVKVGSLAVLLNHEKFNQVHQNLQNQNKSTLHNLLENELKDVNELNKAPRIDLILEGKVKVNTGYSKPSIQLGNHKLDTDDQFDSVWKHFDPWKELKIETDYDIRLIPRWHDQANEDSNKETKEESI